MYKRRKFCSTIVLMLLSEKKTGKKIILTNFAPGTKEMFDIYRKV